MLKMWLVLLGVVAASPAWADNPWHTRLELGNGQLWSSRIAVTITNPAKDAIAGDVVELVVGEKEDQINVVGAEVGKLRVCTAGGTELLFKVTGADRKGMTRGAIPAGATFTMPVEVPAGGSAVQYVYINNLGAWPVPDFLEGKLSKANVTVAVGKVEDVGLKKSELQLIRREGYSGLCASVPNFSDQVVEGLVYANASVLLVRPQLRDVGLDVTRTLEIKGMDIKFANPAAIRVNDGVLFEASLPARSLSDYAITPDKQKSDPKKQYQDLMVRPINLIKDTSFESADAVGKVWRNSGAGEVDSAAGLFGQRAAKVVAGENAKKSWMGLQQTVAIKAGKRYLYAAWVKCANVQGGKITLHAHWLKSDGKVCEKNGMTGVGSELSGNADWTLVSGVLNAPSDAASFQAHLTTNTSGTIWYDGVIVAEVADALISDLPAAVTDLWAVDPIVKVFPGDTPTVTGKAPFAISAARNEDESLQLVYRAQKAIKNLSVEIAAPVHASGSRLSEFEINFVGFVPVDHPTNYYHSSATAWQRRIPGHGSSSDGWAGWWPDPLLLKKSLDLPAHTSQPIWITFHIPKDAPAGDYRGKVLLKSDEGKVAEQEITVRVYDFTLPDQNHVKAVYDVRPGNQWITNPKEPAAKQESWRKASAFMAKRRLSPDRISPEPIIKWEGGKVVADFTEFDKAADEYFKLGHTHTYTPQMFYGFGWAMPPKKFAGIDPYEGAWPYDGADRSRLNPKYKEAYQACLKVYLDHMKQKGWYDKVLLYISDEPHYWEGKSWNGPGSNPLIVPQMKAICTMIHEVDPKLPIYSSTWKHVPMWDGFITAWGIGADGRVPAEKVLDLTRQARVLWTTDGHMCIDTPYCAIERLLPYFCFKYGVEGYEFWGATWLTYDPLQYGWHKFIKQSDTPGHEYYIRYPNGDGYLIYPGGSIGHDGPLSSVRLEQARDGVEDYEYLYLLRERMNKAKAAGRDVSQAQKALDQALGLVGLPTSRGTYSTKLLPRPEAVKEAREAVARAIEALK